MTAEALNNPSRRALFERDASRRYFLLFGAIDPRKGVYQTLAAMARLPDDVLGSVGLLLVGSIRDDVRPSIMSAIDRLRSSRKGVSVLVIDRFLTRRELARVILDTDVLLAPYQRAVGTSGVLTWAAFAGKPVLGQDYGAIGELIRRYELGWPVDTTNPAAIAAKMSEIAARQEEPRMNVDAYRTLCSPWQFAATTYRAVGEL